MREVDIHELDDRLDPGESINPGSAHILTSGIADLGIRLDDRQLTQFARFHAELVDWNSRFNLTRITEWDRAQSNHYLDSLTVALGVPASVLESGRFADVGSGAGFPGIPMKVAFPGMTGVLIESVGKKARFLDHIVDVLGLDGLEVRRARSEELAHEAGYREGFDVVVSRAVGPAQVLAELTLPFCRIGGLAVLHKSRSAEDEVEASATAIEAMGGATKSVIDVSVTGLDQGKTLVVIEKVSGTPGRYPRRPGMPAKRPL
jgi:16S rRNA (guanine527-N7)-methyltransferase